MALKYYYETPTTSDTITLVVKTPNSNGILVRPYSVSTVTIYFAERTPGGRYHGNSTRNLESSAAGAEVQSFLEIYTADPSAANKAAYEESLSRAELANQQVTDYFREAVPVEVLGSTDYPAWLDPDQVPAEDVERVTTDNLLSMTSDGVFEVVWNPSGHREGDYFVCWEYYTEPAGELLAESVRFRMDPDAQLTTPIPTKLTDPSKYPTLFDRYTPSRLKQQMSSADETPEVLEFITGLMGSMYQYIEDQANGLIGLYDANVIPEAFLPVMARMLGTTLTSDDPVLWRRQIARAIPLAKKKGSLGGLREALALSGNTLVRLSWLWQVQSQYTFQEVVEIEADNQESISLSYAIITPLDSNNFELYHRAADSDAWTTLSSDYISASVVDDRGVLTWLGTDLSVSPIELAAGDHLRIVYEIVEVPPSDQEIETYIRSLSLLDQRDDRGALPPKNWNLRGLPDDDPLFDLIVTTRHPAADPVVFGKVRTEFPFGENVYNAEEWNGSIRSSTNPCHLDPDFIDQCTACRSSSYEIEIEVPSYHEHVVAEIRELLSRFMPFHTEPLKIILHVMHDLYIPTPVFEYEDIHHVTTETYMIQSTQGAFYRAVPLNVASDILKRDMLASSEIAVSGATGTLSSNSIVLLSPGNGLLADGSKSSLELADISSTTGTAANNSNLLEIKSPHVHAGTYSLASTAQGLGVLADSTLPSEPLTTSQFTFDLSNKVLSASGVSLDPDDAWYVESSGIIDYLLDITTDYQVSIDGYSTYDVLGITPDGRIRVDANDLPTAPTAVDFEIFDENAESVVTASGVATCELRTIVDLSYGSVSPYEDIRNYVQHGDLLRVGTASYPVLDFVEGEVHQIVIGNYSDGASAGVSISIYRKIVEKGIGQLGYQGLTLTTSEDYEEDLGIQNGANPPADPVNADLLTNNFLIKIEDDFYTIEGIDGKNISIDGPPVDVKLSGESVTFSIFRFVRQDITVPERIHPDIEEGTAESVDRGEGDNFSAEEETSVSAMAVGSTKPGSVVMQTAFDIEFTIEYDDGRVEKGKIEE